MKDKKIAKKIKNWDTVYMKRYPCHLAARQRLLQLIKARRTKGADDMD